MEYRFPPLYKYIAFFIILFLFLRHYKQLTQDKYLIISILITLLVVLLDYMLILNHPNILQTKENFDSDDLDEILDNDKIIVNKNTSKVNTQRQPIIQCNHCKQYSNKTGLPILKPINYDMDNYSEYDMNFYDSQFI